MTSNQNLPEIYWFKFDRLIDSNKKWLNKEGDLTDYFNYGFSEEIWKCYQNKVRKLYHKAKPDDYNQVINRLKMDVLADNCGIDFGGLCPPYNQSITKINDTDFLHDRIILRCRKDNFNPNQLFLNLNFHNWPIEEFLCHFQDYKKNEDKKEIQSIQYSNELQQIKNIIDQQNKSMNDIYMIKQTKFNNKINTCNFQGFNLYQQCLPIQPLYLNGQSNEFKKRFWNLCKIFLLIFLEDKKQEKSRDKSHEKKSKKIKKEKKKDSHKHKYSQEQRKYSDDQRVIQKADKKQNTYLIELNNHLSSSNKDKKKEAMIN